MGEGAVPLERPPHPGEPAPGASPREDRPYLRPLRSPPWAGRAWLAALIALIAGAGVAYTFWKTGLVEPGMAPPLAAPAPAPPQKPAEPAMRHPLEAAAPAAEPLPVLAESDGVLYAALAQLIGERALLALVQHERIVTRIVATVDNLPRRSAPQRMMPLHPVPGAFDAPGGASIGARNAARYAPYVALAQALDARAGVDLYVRFYPLFQKAYAEIGFPNAYFNDRLIEALDDLLAAPEPQEPVALSRPKVFYEFAAPELEARSAGQKILMRMGAANAAKVKAKLREIRAELDKRVAR